MNKMIMNTCYFILRTKLLSPQQMKLLKNMVWVVNTIVLFFINKLPGITIKELLITLEISKQGSHGTLRKLKEEGLIIEETSEIDRRVKKLYSTDKGDALIRKLNKAQDDLFHRTKQKVGNDWYAIMEELANYREGFKTIEHLKED